MIADTTSLELVAKGITTYEMKKEVIFLFDCRLYGKMRYISRTEFLWEHIRKGEIEIPEFVYDHDEELEYRSLMDYGLESDHQRGFDAPAMDTSSSMYSLRCIS